jgi:transposase
MNTSTPRRHLSPEEKVALLRRHLLEKVPISNLCDEHGIQPSQFYLWQKAFFENGAAAFQSNGRNGKKAEQTHDKQRIAFLEAKLQRKDEVIAELMEDHVRLKKSLGES